MRYLGLSGFLSRIFASGMKNTTERSAISTGRRGQRSNWSGRLPTNPTAAINFRLRRASSWIFDHNASREAIVPSGGSASTLPPKHLRIAIDLSL